MMIISQENKKRREQGKMSRQEKMSKCKTEDSDGVGLPQEEKFEKKFVFLFSFSFSA
jgi:hypothetical protein